MHVERFVIRNFRAIQYADIRLRPGLNVLVGRNGSGKSTVLAAFRILLDAMLGRQSRELDESDIFGDAKFAGPADVIIAATFAGFGETARDKQLRLRMKADDVNQSQWLMYRFRPKVDVRTQIHDGDKKTTELTAKDYESERLIGVTADPSTLTWDDDPDGDDLTEKDLASIFVTEIPALRNVVDELRRQRTSPLNELLTTVEVPAIEQQNVEAAYEQAQKTTEAVAALAEIASAIGTSYDTLTSENTIKIRLGLTRPRYASIIRDLAVFLTDNQVSEMELRRNGLGFNNLLYIAMLLESFRRRAANKEGSPILLIEEPEAHLHPQAQEALLRSIAEQPFQTIATTHSPHVTMSAGLRSIVNLDRADEVKGFNIVDAAGINEEEISDLERFLNADRGTILFAAVVILVEGPAEQILVPLYAANAGHSLSKLGIQVCSVNGTHFSVFEKLLGPLGSNRPYVIIRDADAHNGPERTKLPTFDDGKNISVRENEFVTSTTLEYAITNPQSTGALAETAIDLEMPQLADLLAEAAVSGQVTGDLQLRVLRGAVRAGKARFAQAFGRRVTDYGLTAPDYIARAIDSAVQQSPAYRANA